MKRTAFLSILLVLSMMGFSQSIEHVIVIGIDGMSPDGIANAATPTMIQLILSDLPG